MSSKFSKEFLFKLRNEISVSDLIKELKIPQFQEGENILFKCPICEGYNTGVFFKKNLCRCFSCEKNFNTIDLVELLTGAGFKESVRYLTMYYKNLKELKQKKEAEKRSEVDQEEIRVLIARALKEIEHSGV